MEPHELAMAALSQVVQSNRDATSHRGNTSSPASRMANSKSVDNNAKTLSSLADVSRAAMAMSQSGRRQEQEEQGQDSTTTTSDNSQSTNGGFDAASTPPTSSSDAHSSQNTNTEAALSQLSQLSQIAEAPINKSSGSRYKQGSSTAGQKRTADGEVKSASPNSPERSKARGHSRNTSAVSNVSTASTRIGELSSELRTRLKYAMVKVNNGWQSHSIDEIEALASQKGSPTSSNSTEKIRLSAIASPRSVMLANAQTHSSNIQSITRAPTADFDLYSPSDQPSRTYESFWRDHSTTSHPSIRDSSISRTTTPPSKGLAPPADIRPTFPSRRSNTPKFSKPPTIPSHGSNSDYQPSAPQTPRQSDVRENGIIQTSSQKTIQEQDAIETLLFMSSPGNSGNMGHNFPPRSQLSPQASPLRAEFNTSHPPQRFLSSHSKRVEFHNLPSSRSTDSSEVGTSRPGRAHGDAIDRLLDEMADESSDDEEIVLTRYESPRRFAAEKA